MVRSHDGRDWVGEGYLFQDLCPDDRMDLHLLEFFRGKPARLADDVIGYCEFSDVMQKCCRSQCIGLLLAKAHLAGYRERVGSYTMKVPMSGVIFGVDSKGQRLNRPHMEFRDLLHVALFCFYLDFLYLYPALLFLQPTQIK